MERDSRNQNRYAVSARDVDSAELSEKVSRPLGLLIHSVINACVAGICALGAGSVLGDFEGIYAGLQMPVYAASHLAANAEWVWWAFGVVAVLIAGRVIRNSEFTRRELRRQKLWVRLFTLAFGIFLGLSIWLLYLPILEAAANA